MEAGRSDKPTDSIWPRRW